MASGRTTYAVRLSVGDAQRVHSRLSLRMCLYLKFLPEDPHEG